MTKKLFGFIAAFAGFLVNAVSAFNSPFSRYGSDEVERIRERLINRAHNDGAVLLMPKPAQRNERFLWLVAHGSHVSHVSHSSHVSHASGISGGSGSSCSVMTTLPPVISASAIPGFKDATIQGQKNLPLMLHLPSSTATYSIIQYKIKSQPLNGTVTIGDNGTIMFSPNPGFVGSDIFSLIATDGFTSTDPVSFAVVIKAE
jgi:hypothetical protein